MKINKFIKIWGLILFINGGRLMAEQTQQLFPDPWITIKDDQIGLQADFPHRPLEMTFDFPFQNLPPTGQIHFYSVPTKAGLLVLSTFSSSAIKPEWLQKEQLHQFFENVLVPHFFFNPAVFQDHQVFNFRMGEFNEQDAAFFEFTFRDHGVVKKLDGIAQVHHQTAYLSFYLASEKDFDIEVLNRFLSTIQFPINP